MDDRLTGVVAAVVGAAIVTVGTVEYVSPGLAAEPLDPLATGALVVATGLSLLAAGLLSVAAGVDHPALRAATGVGLFALALAVLSPDALLFGGVFWLALVAAALVGVGAYRTVVDAR
jgi:hypothetical protein